MYTGVTARSRTPYRKPMGINGDFSICLQLDSNHRRDNAKVTMSNSNNLKIKFLMMFLIKSKSSEQFKKDIN